MLLGRAGCITRVYWRSGAGKFQRSQHFCGVFFSAKKLVVLSILWCLQVKHFHSFYEYIWLGFRVRRLNITSASSAFHPSYTLTTHGKRDTLWHLQLLLWEFSFSHIFTQQQQLDIHYTAFFHLISAAPEWKKIKLINPHWSPKFLPPSSCNQQVWSIMSFIILTDS